MWVVSVRVCGLVSLWVCLLHRINHLPTRDDRHTHGDISSITPTYAQGDLAHETDHLPVYEHMDRCDTRKGFPVLGWDLGVKFISGS